MNIQLQGEFQKHDDSYQGNLAKAQELVCALRHDDTGVQWNSLVRRESVENTPIARIMFGGDSRQIITLIVKQGKTEQQWWLGSGRGAESQVDYPLIPPCGSEFRFMIEYTRGLWYVNFPAEENNAYVNHEPVRIALLENGDSIRVKQLQATFYG